MPESTIGDDDEGHEPQEEEVDPEGDGVLRDAAGARLPPEDPPVGLKEDEVAESVRAIRAAQAPLQRPLTFGREAGMLFADGPSEGLIGASAERYVPQVGSLLPFGPHEPGVLESHWLVGQV